MGDTPYKKFMFETDFDELTERNERAKAAAKAKAAAGEQADAEPEPEPEPEAPTFSEEDLERARAKARAEGRQQGIDEASSATEKQVADTLNTLVQQAQALFEAQADANQDIARNAITVAAALVRKLFPTLNQETATQQMEAMLDAALGQLTGESEITIRVPAELAEDIHGRIEAVSEMAGFRGDVKVLGDPSLAVGDCRLEWSSGGVARSTTELAEQLDEIVARHLETDAAHHPAPTPEAGPADAGEQAATPEAAADAAMEAPETTETSVEPEPAAPKEVAATEGSAAAEAEPVAEPEPMAEPEPVAEAQPEATPAAPDLEPAPEPAPTEIAAPEMPEMPDPAAEAAAPALPSDDIFHPVEEPAQTEPALDADDIAGGPPPVPSEEFMAEAEAEAALHPHIEAAGAEDHAPEPSEDLTAAPEPDETAEDPAEDLDPKARPVGGADLDIIDDL